MMSNYQVSEYEIARPTLQTYYRYGTYDDAYRFVVHNSARVYTHLYVYIITRIV